MWLWIIARTECLPVAVSKNLKRTNQKYLCFMLLRSLYRSHRFEWIWENNWRELERHMRSSCDFDHSVNLACLCCNERIAEDSPIEVSISYVSLILQGIQFSFARMSKLLMWTTWNHSFPKWFVSVCGLELFTFERQISEPINLKLFICCIISINAFTPCLFVTIRK